MPRKFSWQAPEFNHDLVNMMDVCPVRRETDPIKLEFVEAFLNQAIIWPFLIDQAYCEKMKWFVVPAFFNNSPDEYLENLLRSTVLNNEPFFYGIVLDDRRKKCLEGGESFVFRIESNLRELLNFSEWSFASDCICLLSKEGLWSLLYNRYHDFCIVSGSCQFIEDVLKTAVIPGLDKFLQEGNIELTVLEKTAMPVEFWFLRNVFDRYASHQKKLKRVMAEQGMVF